MADGNSGIAAAAAPEGLQQLAIKQLREWAPGPYSDEDLRTRIRSSVERGSAYDLQSPEQILQFAAVSFLLGEHFDSDPEHTWTAEVLTAADASPDERAAMLLAIAQMVADEQGGE